MAYTINWDQVASLVQDYYVPRIKDNFFLSNALFYRWQKSKQTTYSGGRSIVVPLSYAPEGGGGVWWSGTDKMDTRVRNPIQAAQFFAKNAAVPISIDEDEELQVDGPTAITTLLNAKMKIANRTIIDLLGGNNGIFNDGTNTKAITGLQSALIGNIATVQQTFGGIPRGGSGSTNAWWMHQADTTAYTTGSNYIDTAPYFGPWEKIWAQIGLASGKKPTIVICNWGVYTAAHRAIMQSTNYYRPTQNTELAEAGFENIMWKNAPVVVDEKVPRTAAKVEKAYFVHEPSMMFKVHSKRNISFSGWREPTDQFARVGYIQFRGEMAWDEMRCHGMEDNVTTSSLS